VKFNWGALTEVKMSGLKEVGKGIYGIKYTFDGVFQFDNIDLQKLKWGDSIRDNKGTGMFLYVNKCGSCKLNYLAGTLIIDFEKCDKCYRSRLFNHNSEY
jgi:hypothetical protein